MIPGIGPISGGAGGIDAGTDFGSDILENGAFYGGTKVYNLGPEPKTSNTIIIAAVVVVAFAMLGRK